MDLWDSLNMLIIGIISTLIFQVVVYPVLPSTIRERVTYWKAWVRKYYSASHVNFELVSKATTEQPDVLAHEMVEKVETMFRSKDYPVSRDDLLLTVSTKIGKQEVKANLSFYPDQNGMFDGMEIKTVGGDSFRHLDDCLMEMREADQKIKNVVKDADMKINPKFCLACKLKSLPQAKTILDSMSTDMMSYTTPDGHDFDLYDGKIEYYDTEIHRDMSSLLKKIIVAHS